MILGCVLSKSILYDDIEVYHGRSSSLDSKQQVFCFLGFFLSILFKDNTLAKETTSHFLAANILERNS